MRHASLGGSNSGMKKIIIGNSGSGKSYLAKSMSEQLGIPVVHLDELFWMPGGFNEKRPKDIVFDEIEQLSKGASWIVEGVYGELASRFFSEADELIWLNFEWSECESGLLARGSESSKQLDPESAEANFRQLLIWASEYWSRNDLRSCKGHSELVDNFKGEKTVLRNRLEVDEYIGNPRSDSVAACNAAKPPL